MNNKFYKKIICILLFTLSIFTLVGCGNSSDSGNKGDGDSNAEKNVVPLEDFHLVYADADKYKGSTVEFYGKIFLEPERDEDGTYLQVFSSDKGNDSNTIVGINDPNLDVKSGDIVYIKGEVKGEESGENAFGGKLSLPVILASSIEKVDYATAFDPALKTIEVNKEINQHGYIMNLSKVEIAEGETRAYLKIQNDSNNKISFYSFNSVITQGSNQISESDNWDADYQEINSEILPGIISEGIVTFEPVDINGGDFKIFFEGSCDDYTLDFEPFVFEVVME